MQRTWLLTSLSSPNACLVRLCRVVLLQVDVAALFLPTAVLFAFPTQGLFAFLERDVTNQRQPVFNPHHSVSVPPSQGLFAFLEGDVTNQLRRVYPVRPERADEWLGGEIARAARDPGALGVFRCAALDAAYSACAHCRPLLGA